MTTPPDPSKHNDAATYLADVATHVRVLLDPIKAGAKAHNHQGTAKHYEDNSILFLQADPSTHAKTWEALSLIVEQVKLAADALHQQVPTGTSTKARDVANEAWAKLDESEHAARLARDTPPS